MKGEMGSGTASKEASAGYPGTRLGARGRCPGLGCDSRRWTPPCPDPSQPPLPPSLFSSAPSPISAPSPLSPPLPGRPPCPRGPSPPPPPPPTSAHLASTLARPLVLPRPRTSAGAATTTVPESPQLMPPPCRLPAHSQTQITLSQLPGPPHSPEYTRTPPRYPRIGRSTPLPSRRSTVTRVPISRMPQLSKRTLALPGRTRTLAPSKSNLSSRRLLARSRTRFGYLIAGHAVHS